jgi:hypothetical protein
MKSLASLVLVGLLTLVPVLGIGCADEKDSGTTPPPPAVENAYVGAAKCSSCHAGIAATLEASGHPHKVTEVDNGQRPGAPLILPDNPPAGKTWAEIKYVIGGWGWKTRFVTQDMQVVIGEGVQYNIPTPQFAEPAWAAYHVGEVTPYNYACFRCHTTGPDEASNAFDQPGVQCEACHGKGKTHSLHPRRDNIVTDDSALACGQCHYRDPNRARIIAKGTFGDHHEQYEEMKDGPHAGLKCTTCHDYHKGIRRGQVGGIVKTCTSAGCHAGAQVNHVGGGISPNCVDCHMGRATKSARSVHKYQGDVRTHIFKIHDGPEGQADMFETVGGNTYVKQGYGVTLDYACYSCHKDEAGVGGDFSTKTLAQLRAKAESIHDTEAMTGR